LFVVVVVVVVVAAAAHKRHMNDVIDVAVTAGEQVDSDCHRHSCSSASAEQSRHQSLVGLDDHPSTPDISRRRLTSVSRRLRSVSRRLRSVSRRLSGVEAGRTTQTLSFAEKCDDDRAAPDHCSSDRRIVWAARDDQQQQHQQQLKRNEESAGKNDDDTRSTCPAGIGLS